MYKNYIYKKKIVILQIGYKEESKYKIYLSKMIPRDSNSQPMTLYFS